MFLPTTKIFRMLCQKAIPKEKNDLAVVYALWTKVAAMEPNNRLVNEYFNLPKGLWPKLDHYQSLKIAYTEDAKTLTTKNKEKRIIKFLLRLNVEFKFLAKIDCFSLMKYLLLFTEKRAEGL